MYDALKDLDMNSLETQLSPNAMTLCLKVSSNASKRTLTTAFMQGPLVMKLHAYLSLSMDDFQ
jgi:hypothetical protein